MKKRIALLFSLLLLLTTPAARCETVKDREGAVRQDRSKMENDARWIYNDFEKGFAEARRTGKPLMVVLRCVPCVSCMGIDAGILEATDLNPLFDQFVCVRVINANALDLSRFQFDYDLSLSTLFFNGDGTVYGRFGSWTHQRDSADRSTAGFRAALEGVLEIHKAYPANQAALAGKQGKTMPFKVPVEFPDLAAKYGRNLDWEGKVVGSCVHCHQIGDAYRWHYRNQGQPLPMEMIYPMPTPETIGLTLDGATRARVVAVEPASIAAAAGFKKGDDILSLGGQPIVSAADIAWVLHHTPASATLGAVVGRTDSQQILTALLPDGWRQKTDISRRVGTWPMRAMAGGGLKVEDLSDEEREKRGLLKDQLAMLVTGVGQWGLHGTAKQRGFQKDDIVVEVEGLKGRHTESAFIGALLQAYPKKAEVKTTVLRNGNPVELKLPMQ